MSTNSERQFGLAMITPASSANELASVNAARLHHQPILQPDPAGIVAVLPGVDRTLVGGQAPRDIRQARVAGGLRFVVTGRVLVALDPA